MELLLAMPIVMDNSITFGTRMVTAGIDVFNYRIESNNNHRIWLQQLSHVTAFQSPDLVL